jgi:imidazolonepropionase-like amidohydrolase
MMLAVRGGTIKTMAGPDIPEGVLLVNEGKIATVGGKDTQIPEGTQILEAAGKVITPGLIDAHTHLGVCEDGIRQDFGDVNEMTNPVTSHLRVLDAINPADPAFRDALAGGVTTAQVLPGSANVIGGEGVVLKNRGATVEEMLLMERSAMKVAFGENPRWVYGEMQKKYPQTRMAIAATLREELVKAANYRREEEAGTLKERDLKMEALCRVLRGEVVMRAHAHRADDILTALRIAEEFQVKITIEHCTEGQKIVSRLAAKKVPVALGPNLSSKSKIELREASWENIVQLARAGVPFSIITDHPVVPIQYLNTCAALAVREGLKEDEALAGITINAARHLGLEDRVGSLEAGKDADFVIWQGDPLDSRSRVWKTFIDGQVVYADKTAGEV